MRNVTLCARANAFGLIQLDLARAERPLLVVHVAGRIGRSFQARMTDIVHHRDVGDAVAARAEQLIAHAVERALVEIGIAFRAVGAEQQPAILIMHRAFGAEVGGFGVVGDLLRMQQQIELLDLGIAFEHDMRLVGTAHLERAGVTRDGAAIARGRQARHIEVEQIVLLAHLPADRFLRALQDPDRTGRRIVSRDGDDWEREEDGEREAASPVCRMGNWRHGVESTRSEAASLPKVQAGGKPSCVQWARVAHRCSVVWRLLTRRQVKWRVAGRGREQ